MVRNPEVEYRLPNGVKDSLVSLKSRHYIGFVGEIVFDLEVTEL